MSLTASQGTRRGGRQESTGRARVRRVHNRRVAKSTVRLPREVREPFDVFVNGVPQQLGVDYSVRSGALVFERELRKDRISGWRWFLGAWGVGTYRQHDSVDVRYQARDGSARVAEALDIEAG